MLASVYGSLAQWMNLHFATGKENSSPSGKQVREVIIVRTLKDIVFATSNSNMLMAPRIVETIVTVPPRETCSFYECVEEENPL